MRVLANFKMIWLATALAILAVGAPAIAQELQGLQAQSGPRLDFPAGLATDGRAVYVANSRNNTVEAIDDNVEVATNRRGQAVSRKAATTASASRRASTAPTA